MTMAVQTPAGEPQHARFLRDWLRLATRGELLEVRSLHKRGDRAPVRQGWYADPAAAAAHITRSLQNGDDVYVGAQPRCRDGGGEADVANLRWVYSDVDYGTTGHAKPAPYATRSDALAAIRRAAEQLGASPTFLVHTGGGFQVWYALKDPLPEPAWRDAIARLTHAVGGDPNATDPARILRVPGTKNFKVAPPRPVTLEAASGCFVEGERFARLPAPPPEPPAFKPRIVGSRFATDRPFDLANEVPIAEVFDWLGIAMHREGQRVYCACPIHDGSNPSQMVVGGSSNLACCFGDCNERAYTPVDVVAHVRGVEPKAAVELMAERFNFQGFAARVYPINRPVATTTAVPSVTWEEPVPLGEQGAPPFPDGVLRGIVGRFVEELALSTQTPRDLPAMLALSVLSTACGGKVCVQLPAYREPVNLFVAVAMPPGARKSEVFRRVVRPLDDFERAARDAAPAVDPNDKDAPAPLRLYVDDCTPETVAFHLHAQGGRLALLSAEGGDVFAMMAGRYADAPNIGVYLKGHAGDKIAVDRMKRAGQLVWNPALTVGIATQPGTLRTLAAKRELTARGLVARFLFGLPKSNVGYRTTTAPALSHETRDMYHQLVTLLLEHPMGQDVEGRPAPHRLLLNGEALALYHDFAERAEVWQRPGGPLSGRMAEWGAKLVGATMRVAGLIHMSENCHEPAPWSLAMDGDTILRAIHLSEEYLIPQARFAFDVMSDTEAVETARRILGWAKANRKREFSARDAHRALGGKGAREDVVDPALEVLLSHGWIQVAEVAEVDGRSKGGRPKGARFHVHPSV